MRDLISRQAAYDALMAEPLKWDDSSVWESARCHQWMMDMDVIKALPSAQPERKRGKWTKENACEFCGFQPWFERDIHTLSFCPNCGADMR